MNSNWSYSPETVKLGCGLCDLDLWPFAWTLPWSLVITPENFMMIRWWEHSQKGVTDRRTDRQRQTENTIHRAAWSQLKTVRVSTCPCQKWIKHQQMWNQWSRDRECHTAHRLNGSQVAIFTGGRAPLELSFAKQHRANCSKTYVSIDPPHYVVIGHALCVGLLQERLRFTRRDDLAKLGRHKIRMLVGHKMNNFH